MSPDQLPERVRIAGGMSRYQVGVRAGGCGHAVRISVLLAATVTWPKR
jgi:hypothetical protein